VPRVSSSSSHNGQPLQRDVRERLAQSSYEVSGLRLLLGRLLDCFL
jgi:hypothetical protein